MFHSSLLCSLVFALGLTISNYFLDWLASHSRSRRGKFLTTFHFFFSYLQLVTVIIILIIALASCTNTITRKEKWKVAAKKSRFKLSPSSFDMVSDNKFYGENALTDFARHSRFYRMLFSGEWAANHTRYTLILPHELWIIKIRRSSNYTASTELC